LVADAVAAAPGGPIHVLLSDREAEHIPGCNMAFRTDALRAIGGFDPRFSVAGDDVDICWRLQRQGWKLGFSPSAVVWHHRRNSVRGYWRQQRGYGKAEALLERKWPERYNRAGHLTWAGQVYAGVSKAPPPRRWRLYQGVWGTAAYQSGDRRAPSTLSSLPSMPEWYLLIAAIGALSVLGFQWRPLRLTLFAVLAAVVSIFLHAGLGAARAVYSPGARTLMERFQLRSLTGFFHLAQPVARLSGRLPKGLSPWRGRGMWRWSMPRRRTLLFWRERWESPTVTLESIETQLRSEGAAVLRGSEYDRWDLEVLGGALGSVRLATAVEEHGSGRQLVRLRLWPRCSWAWILAGVALLAISVGAGLSNAWITSALLFVATALLAVTVVRQCGAASGALSEVLGRFQ
jgi:hypothetical protein